MEAGRFCSFQYHAGSGGPYAAVPALLPPENLTDTPAQARASAAMTMIGTSTSDAGSPRAAAFSSDTLGQGEKVGDALQGARHHLVGQGCAGQNQHGGSRARWR